MAKRRNAMARALGFDDFYDYKVSKTEGFSKRRLFEMLDALRDGTATLNERARASLDDDDRQPWNISRELLETKRPWTPTSPSARPSRPGAVIRPDGYSV